MKNENILILGGNTPNNETWLKKISSPLKKDNKIKTIKYSHWNTESSLDIEKELNKVVKELEEWKDYIIIAKSVGSVISLIGIERNIIKPKNLIILGLPLRYTERNKIDIISLLEKSYKISNISIIEQEYDPIGTYKEVEQIIPNYINLYKIPGHYHIYGNIQIIKKIIEENILR